MKQRIFYFDFLRIFAALAVVMLHTAASQYGLEGIYHDSACLYDGFVRWCVPIFVMISGALFLEPAKTITINNILKKYIPRIVIIFFVWSLFYTCLSCFSKNNFNVAFIIINIIYGYYHMWFLYMIAGLYLIIPFLRPITEKKDKNLILYLLIIWLVAASIIPFINFMFPITKMFSEFIIKNKFYFSFPLSFIGYFVLGYYLHNYVNIGKNIILVTALILSFFITVIGDTIYSLPNKQSFFFDNFSPFVIITAISIFLLIKNKCYQNKQPNKAILKLSDLTLGVYMIHPFFIFVLTKLNLFGIINFQLNDNNFVAIPIAFVLVSFLSFSSVYLLSKIPFVKKFVC